jgi:hypothetical protein
MMGWGYETRVAVVVLCVRPLVSPERRRRRRRNCGTCRRPSLPPRTERSSICSLRSFAFRSNAAAAQLMAAPSTSRSCESGGRESRARRPPTSFSPLDRVIQASTMRPGTRLVWHPPHPHRFESGASPAPTHGAGTFRRSVETRLPGLQGTRVWPRRRPCSVLTIQEAAGVFGRPSSTAFAGCSL